MVLVSSLFHRHVLVGRATSPRVLACLVPLSSSTSTLDKNYKNKNKNNNAVLLYQRFSSSTLPLGTRQLLSGPNKHYNNNNNQQQQQRGRRSRTLAPPFLLDSTQVMFQSTTAQQDEKTTIQADAQLVHKEHAKTVATPTGTTTSTTTTSSSSSSSSSSFSLGTLDFGIPALIPEWKRMFSTQTLFTDVSAGLTVGCIAVPLSLAIAVASGVPPEVGLVTAAVSGVAGAMLGGTTLAVTGPAAAISLLVVDAVQSHGLPALPLITLACGALQLASGLTRMGVYAKVVPVSVIAGFTTGVGTLILTGQLPKALGLHAPAGLNPMEVVGFLASHLPDISPAAATLAVGTSAAMLFLPKLHAKIPAALLAVGGATVATHTLGLDVTLIGEIPTGLAAFSFGVPIMPSMESWPSLAATTLLIYGMTSVESLLSCAALAKMKKTPYRYNPDQELVGQGMANVGAAMFMGMPVTSVIARSGLNVRCGAETRLPAIIQAGFVFSSVVFLSNTISLIPMPALSGMLITTGMAMLSPAEFKHCYAVTKLDAVPFATTVAGMISFGLAEGIGIGCVSAMALHYGPYQTALGTKTSRLQVKQADPREENVDPNTALYHLHGPVNFLSMFAIDNMMKDLEARLQASSSSSSSLSDGGAVIDKIVLDMEGVTALEFTGVEELVVRSLEAAHGTATVQMINCNAALMDALDQCDPQRQIERQLGEANNNGTDDDETRVTF